VGRALSPANPYVLPQKTSPLASDLDEASLLFVTWRLSGSIPQVRLPRRLAGQSAGPTSQSAGVAFLASDRRCWMARAEVRAWVIMPNHVPVLLRAEVHLPVITRWLKGSTARQANLILGRTGKAFWQDESFDHWVRDEVDWPESFAMWAESGQRRSGVESSRLALVDRRLGRRKRLPHNCRKPLPTGRVEVGRGC